MRWYWEREMCVSGERDRLQCSNKILVCDSEKRGKKRGKGSGKAGTAMKRKKEWWWSWFWYRISPFILLITSLQSRGSLHSFTLKSVWLVIITMLSKPILLMLLLTFSVSMGAYTYRRQVPDDCTQRRRAMDSSVKKVVMFFNSKQTLYENERQMYDDYCLWVFLYINFFWRQISNLAAVPWHPC